MTIKVRCRRCYFVSIDGSTLFGKDAICPDRRDHDWEQYEGNVAPGLCDPRRETGIKFDGAGSDGNEPKLRWHLLPFIALIEVVKVLTWAVTRKSPPPYPEHNWRKVDNARDRYFSALMRHITSWWHGERSDSESGRHHLAHAICCLLFLLTFDLESEEKAKREGSP